MRTLVGLAIAAGVVCAGAFAFSPRSLPPLAETRLPIATMQINGLARSAAGLVAAGELGHILVSTDEGQSWTPAKLSADRQALITRLVFADDRNGLALGHEGWILRTADGGLSWQETAFTEKGGEPLMGAARLASGAWLVVGAFGRALRSEDEGRSWQRTAFAEGADWHLNAVATSADKATVIVAGEAGTILRSGDGGAAWTTVEPFYNGSFYGVAWISPGNWVAYGMRGNVYRSTDDGLTWSKSTVPAPISVFGHTVADGRLFLVGQGGMVMLSTDGGSTFRIVRRQGRATLTEMVAGADRNWLLGSDGGLQRFIVPAEQKEALGASASRHTSALEASHASR